MAAAVRDWPWWLAIVIGCGRTEPLPGWVFETGSVDGNAGRGDGPGGASGKGGQGGPNAKAGTRGRADGGQTAAGTAGQSAAVGGGTSAGSGSDVGGASFEDRCVVPGPPPEIGRADGSDYQLGTPAEFLDIYPTYDHLALGDVNADGRPDFLGNANDDLHLYTSVGRGMLAELVPLEVGMQSVGYHGAAQLVPVDADRSLDVVIGHQSGMSVVWNDGRGAFSRFVLTEGPPTARIAVTDVDADGDTDVVGLRSDPSTVIDDLVLFYLSDGRGAFVLRELAFGEHLYRLRVADVTGDGLPDLLLVTGRDPKIEVYEQNSAGDFARSVELALGSGPPSGVWLQTGDLDGDGLLDLAVVQDEDKPDREHVWIAYQEDGALGPLRRTIQIPKDAGNIAGGEPRIADVNLDGRMDIAFPSSAFDMVVLLRTADGSFHEVHTAFPTAGSIYDEAIAIGDVNCDGCPDILGAQVGQIVLFPGVACAH